MWIVLFIAVCICSCLAQDEVCSPPCGCFNTGYPWDDRAPPHTWQQQEIEWRLYTRANPTLPTLLRWDLTTPSDYDGSKTTFYLIHGWSSSGDTMQTTKDALLQNADVNVVIVDWSTGAGYVLYPQSASNTRVLGACSAHLASHLIAQDGASMDNMHCIGHSLGAQACGSMGLYTNGTLGRISGQDPAGPWFESNDTRLRLDETDAQFVDNVHTNADGDIYVGIGANIGHVDFWPNAGSVQPPCDGTMGCDHSIAREYYRISIAESACTFPSYPCSSKENANNGLCTTCQDGVDCQRLGFYSNTMPGRGSYWLATNVEYPYCQG